MVFRGKCPFRVFIKSKPGKYEIKLWVAADAKNFYPSNMQVDTGKSGGVREKKQGLRIVKDTVCHMCGTGRGFTTDYFFTSCELENFLLSKNMSVVGTLRKNKPETTALFLSGKQRNAPYFVFGFIDDLTLVSYVPARNKTVILLSSQHHDENHKPEIIMHYKATKGGVDFLYK